MREAPALKQGEKVYEDGSYTVYVFDSTEAADGLCCGDDK